MLPVKRRKLLDDLLEEEDEKFKSRGTRRSKDYYPVTTDTRLNFDPTNFETYNLYKINNVLTEEVSNSKNALFRPEEFGQKMGLMTSLRLPDVCLSPNGLYTQSGKVSSALVFCGTRQFQREIWTQILTFQDWAFDKVVACKAQWMRLKKGDGAIIVPINAKNEIDVKILESVSQNDTTEQNTLFRYTRTKYENAVITPIHRKDEHFFVEEIMTNTNPDSRMSEDKTESFAMHYRAKYGLEVTCRKQELLRVSGADKRHHMFSEIIGKTNPKAKSTDGDMKFIPQFVLVEPVPANLWREVQMIPFVIKRLTSMIR